MLSAQDDFLVRQALQIVESIWDPASLLATGQVGRASLFMLLV
jgi:hypothetical protein